MNLKTILELSISAVVFAMMLVLKVYFKHHTDGNAKKNKRKRRLTFFGLIISAWYFIAVVINIITGGMKGINVEFEMFSPRLTLFGISFARTTLTSYAILAVLAVLCLLFRFVAFPKFKDEPKGLQNVVEAGVEAMQKFTVSTAGDLSDELPAYMFSVALFIVGCAATELLGQRPPTSDLETTFSLAIITLFLINYYAIRKKRLSGRLKAMASPSPIIFPMKILSDVATPVSLACRLFGNMLGGMIVMDLLKNSLGGYAVGLTALAGLYFNLFHPLIQTYIFIILSMTFIREATE